MVLSRSLDCFKDHSSRSNPDGIQLITTYMSLLCYLSCRYWSQEVSHPVTADIGV